MFLNCKCTYLVFTIPLDETGQVMVMTISMHWYTYYNYSWHIKYDDHAVTLFS